MDLIAITEIHRTVKPGKGSAKPEVEVIKAGKPLVAKSKEEGEELIALKAAREAKTDEEKQAVANLKKTPAKKAPAKKAAPAKSSTKGDGKGEDTGTSGSGEDMV